MFNLRTANTEAVNELSEIGSRPSYGSCRAPTPTTVQNAWCELRQEVVDDLDPLGGDSLQPLSGNRGSIESHQISGINADSPAALQLFLSNQTTRSPSPPPAASSIPLLLLLPNEPTSNPPLHGHLSVGAAFDSTPLSPTLALLPSGRIRGYDEAIRLNSTSTVGRVVESQDLSLTLSLSLHRKEAVKAEERRMGNDKELCYYQGSEAYSSYQLKNMWNDYLSSLLRGVGPSDQSSCTINLLRKSRYATAVQELLEELCNVGSGIMKNNWREKYNTKFCPKENGAGAGGSSSTTQDLPLLSAADTIDYHWKKSKLVSLLGEVNQRYNRYRDKVQTVANSFESVMGLGAAIPYTALAQKAMSRDFRRLKDAIKGQLQLNCKLLEDKESAGSSRVRIKGVTPRLRLLEQNMRQQRAMGIPKFRHSNSAFSKSHVRY